MLDPVTIGLYRLQHLELFHAWFTNPDLDDDADIARYETIREYTRTMPFDTGANLGTYFAMPTAMCKPVLRTARRFMDGQARAHR